LDDAAAMETTSAARWPAKAWAWRVGEAVKFLVEEKKLTLAKALSLHLPIGMMCPVGVVRPRV
jgi:hypothetical protein